MHFKADRQGGLHDLSHNLTLCQPLPSKPYRSGAALRGYQAKSGLKLPGRQKEGALGDVGGRFPHADGAVLVGIHPDCARGEVAIVRHAAAVVSEGRGRGRAGQDGSASLGRRRRRGRRGGKWRRLRTLAVALLETWGGRGGQCRAQTARRTSNYFKVRSVL